MLTTRPVYIVGGLRTPFVKSFTLYRDIQTQELMTIVLKHLVERYHLNGRIIGDVGLGAVINSPLNWNLARECVLGSGLSPYTPAYTLQRACGTSLETTLQLALKIANYQIDDAIAGGVDTNSDLPVLLNPGLGRKLIDISRTKSFLEKLKILTKLRLRDFKPIYPGVKEPRTGKSMGEHCEMMTKDFNIPRAQQDELAYLSHQNASKAYKEGFYDDLVIQMQGIKKDTLIRDQTTLEKMAKLPPVFDKKHGTLTAANSSPLTDGASAVLLTSKGAANKYDYPLLARFVDAEVAAVDFLHGDGLLMAPTIAVSELLKRQQLSLQDFDYYEIHEAFAGQVLCTLEAWDSENYCKKVLQREHALGRIDLSKVNVKGGSIAIGHPFAATGTRIVANLAKILHEAGSGRGLISICTAGGMGIAAILEAI